MSFPPGVKSAHPYHGGTTGGLKRIQSLIGSGSMTRYKDTRNGLLGTDFSTKLSAWLALGCITARQIHFQLLDFEEGRDDQHKGTEGYGKGENKGTAAVRFELLWRDYMRLCTRKFGPRLFHLEGFRNDTSYQWKTPGSKYSGSEVDEMLTRFLRGTTGTSFIDASQRELYLTGYTSNRARQNVASYLAKHLGVNWKLGAEWYECMLTDYDLSSNWGNWQYVAGVGNDPRGEARVFNPIKQGCDYDPDGSYCKAWLEELQGLDDPQEIFQPWKVSKEDRAELGLEGLDMVERPLKKIDFKVGGRVRGNHGGGGRYGGSSRGKANGAGEGGRGRGGGSFGARGGGSRGRGSSKADRGRGYGRQGLMEKASGHHPLIVNGNGISH
jgi:deoxyribodipyrimidine photo-lyase